MQQFYSSLHSLVLLLCLVDVSTSLSLRVELTHVDAIGEFTKHELIRRAARRSATRSAMLQQFPAAAKVPVPVYSSWGEYLMDLAIGTPPQPFPAILDTGSNLVWTQCNGCNKCVEQPVPLFDPSRSRTYSELPCSNRYCRGLPCRSNSCGFATSYGDNSSTAGVLAVDTLTFGSKAKGSIPNLVIGCGLLNGGTLTNGSGIAGFGRLPESLPSQLRLSKFSYCFTPFHSRKKSPLFLGSLADHSKSNVNSGSVQSTPFLKNPKTNPTLYYVRLKGITVGSARLPIPESAFALKANGTGGTIIDSGTQFTYLDATAFEVVKKAFVSDVKLPVVEDADDINALGILCFKLTKSMVAAKVYVPKLVFHFEGADIDLPRDNYIIDDDQEGVLCLAVTGNAVLGDGMSIIGNYQQQNMHVLYDLKHGILSFAPAQCEQL